MKNNRRNFYRILQVQPDASLEIIKNNYRTLLHKLRLHPDLGGENNTASYINLAYATLRNSAKRAVYDRQLLNQYNIGLLSKGHLAQKKSKTDVTSDDTCMENGNRRNYYRILSIQPDASPAIISSSYKMLIKNKTASIELTEEAFSVLSVPEKRKQYDQLLKVNKHVNATTLNLIDRNRKKTKYDASDSRIKTRDAKHSSTASSAYKKSSPYQPLISYYCIFCKTPQSHSPIKNIDDLCVECSSPLYSSPEKLSLPRRFFSRISLITPFSFYTYWPGVETVATLSDLSPTGLRFTSKQALNKNEIIKIEADKFKAVGQVKYLKPAGALFIIGVQFLTIQFNAQKGTFMSASV
jgi:curved DNA-binding protein CbpA